MASEINGGSGKKRRVAIRDIWEEEGKRFHVVCLHLVVVAQPFPSSAVEYNQLNIIIRIRRGGERIK